MANIREKDIKKLDEWNQKELRKLRIAIKNRLASLEANKKKEMAPSHPLSDMDSGQLDNLLVQIRRAEKLGKS